MRRETDNSACFASRTGACPGEHGAVIVNLQQPEAGANSTVFTQQPVPTDQLGNPKAGGREITSQMTVA
jgi:hypothetical protein